MAALRRALSFHLGDEHPVVRRRGVREDVCARRLSHSALQDEKLPGMHLAFGHPYTEHTGADWKSSTHIDIVGRHFDVEIDGVPIMKNSRYLVDYNDLVA